MDVERIIIILIIKWNNIIRYETNIIITGVLVAKESEAMDMKRIGISGSNRTTNIRIIIIINCRWKYTVGPEHEHRISIGIGVDDGR